MDRDSLIDFTFKNINIENDLDALNKDCQNIAFLLDNCNIIIPKSNRFFVQTNASGLQGSVYLRRARAASKTVETQIVKNGAASYAFTGSYDFNHTSPIWQDVLDLGIYGLRARVLKYQQKSTSTDKQNRFYNSCIKVYDAALRFLKRASICAASQGKTEMALGLEHLCDSSPQNLFEKLQTIIIFYFLNCNIEGTLSRTLGRLDTLLYTSFLQEKESFALELIKDFIQEIDALQAPANIPFALGGSDQNGDCLINPLSYMLLNTYKNLSTINTKLHILYSDNMPDDFLRLAFACIQSGKNSIAFICDHVAIEALTKLGADPEDARNYHVVGCYECGAEGELTCSCNARVNIPKALEVILNEGKDVYTGIQLVESPNIDFSDFNSLYKAFERTLVSFANNAIQATNAWERIYFKLHSSPFLSSTYHSSLKQGGDLYCNYTAKYNNSSVNAIGLATAVDSLIAIKHLVYLEKKFTLSEFFNILKSNWENNELLRLRIKNHYPKFGTGNPETDELAQKIIKLLSKTVNNQPNVKGGVWRLGTFSIDGRWVFGEHTYATADGRKAGETLSQNTSATFGADTEGATAHLLSVSSFPHSLTPNGSIADIDLHSSAVRGENGIVALLSTLKTYFQRGGLAIHYNILNTEILKQAKKDPSAYPNLQVRLCGWNVLFSSLSEKEKDEFISRASKEE